MDNGTSVSLSNLKSKLAEKIAGEITLSKNPGETLKKWRTIFEISQSDLATFLKISPSVISDYESGRRKSPGISVISRIVEAILEIDFVKGGKKIRSYERILKGDFTGDAVYDIHEYVSAISFQEFIEIIQAEIIYVPDINYVKPLYGYTIIDSLKAIIQLSWSEFQKLYGWSSERAMIFTGVTTGRSPMIAIRVTNLKPGVVVIHGLHAHEIDKIAIKIAEIENIPLVSSIMPIDEISKALLYYKSI